MIWILEAIGEKTLYCIENWFYTPYLTYFDLYHT